MKDRSKGLGCLLLFALPFAGVGSFMAYRTGAVLWEWNEMRSWSEVPAEILAVHLDRHDGGDSVTYQVRARFRYRVNGVDYEGSRVSLHGGSDNVGEFHENTYRELTRARAKRRSVSCWVDPEDPSRAILYREPRWGLVGFYLIFVVAFGGVGFGLIGGGLLGARRVAREDELAVLHPEEPWLQKDEWRSGRISSTARPAFLMSLVFAILWNAISAPLVFLVPREWSKGNVAALIGLLFPLVGVGLLVWAGRNLLRLWKFGDSVFEMASVPGVIGGRIAGTVRTRTSLAPRDGIDVRLSALVRARVGSGDDARTEEHILWQKSQPVSPSPGPGRLATAIPVAFEIPENLPPSDSSDPNHQYIWRVDVTADVPGIDFATQFEVPVFRTRGGAPGPMPKPSVPVDSRPPDPAVLERRLRKLGIRTESLPEGKRYSFPMARELGSSLYTTLIFLVWTGIVVVLFFSDAPRLFPWVFAGFDLLLFLATVDGWFQASRIEVRPGEIRFRGGLFGRGEEKRWSSVEIAKVGTKRGMQAGHRLLHQVEVVTRWDKHHVIAKRLPDLDTAERLAGEIEAVLRS